MTLGYFWPTCPNPISSDIINRNICSVGTCENDAKVAGSCPVWAGHGECSENPAFMLAKCRKSCDPCGGKFSAYHMQDNK